MPVCVPCCSNGDVVEVSVPHEGAKSSDTFELQVAQKLCKVALPKAPGTHTHTHTHCSLMYLLQCSAAASCYTVLLALTFYMEPIE